MRIAALDLGTNSFHLLVAEVHPGLEQLRAARAGISPPEISTGIFRINQRGWFEYSVSEQGDEKCLRQLDPPERWVYRGDKLLFTDTKLSRVQEWRIPQKSNVAVRAPFVLQANAKELDELYYIRVFKRDRDKREIWLQIVPRMRIVANWYQRSISSPLCRRGGLEAVCSGRFETQRGILHSRRHAIAV